MTKKENNEELKTKINYEGQNFLNFFHANYDKLYEEENLSFIFEVIKNKDENDYDKDSFITEYISFCENKINEVKSS